MFSLLFVVKTMGAGTHPHAGRVGKVGGSAPTKTYVGLTSARPLVDPHKVDHDRNQFVDELKKMGVPVVRSNVAYAPWPDENGQMQQEKSFYVEYRGNGRVTALVARLAKQYNQDAAILWHEDKNGNAPRMAFRFGALDKNKISMVNQMAAKAKLGGWTWDTKSGSLIACSVPQWEDPKDFLRKMHTFSSLMKSAGLQHETKFSKTNAEVLTRDTYDKYTTQTTSN